MPTPTVSRQLAPLNADTRARALELFPDGASTYANLNRGLLRRPPVRPGAPLPTLQTPKTGDRVQISEQARILAANPPVGPTGGAGILAAADTAQAYAGFARFQAMQQAVAVALAANSGNALALLDGGAGTTATPKPPAATAGAAQEQAPVEEDAETTPASPALPTTAKLGALTVTNVEAVADEAGNVRGATGTVDLSAYGLGSVKVDLDLDAENRVTGARLAQNELTMDVGGNRVTFAAGEGESVLSIDAAGNLSFGGRASMDLGGLHLDLGDVSAAAGRDARGNAYVDLQGSYLGNEMSLRFNTDGTVEARFASDGPADLIPGMDKVTSFLERVGVELDTGGEEAGFTFDRRTGAISVDFNGVTGSYNASTGEFSIGGLEVGAGVSLGLENLTVNTRTGSASATVTAGVGAEAGGIGIGVDLAGFSFSYDAQSGDITLSGTQGIAAANLEVTAVLERRGGGYGLKSVNFRANVDEELARDVAAGLNQAYAQGTAVGRQAVREFGRARARGTEAVQHLARGLRNAGDRAGDLLAQAGKLGGRELDDFLAVASRAGTGMNDLLRAAANAGDELGTLARTANQLNGGNLANFLRAAAGKGGGTAAFVRDFGALLADVKRVSGGVANLSVSAGGGISGRINVPGAGAMNATFSRSNGTLKAAGTLNLGGFAFTNAEVSFGANGAVTGVSGGATLATPAFKVGRFRIGSQRVSFSLGFENGRVQARGEFSMSFGFFGRHGARFTLGSGGFDVQAF